MSIFFFVYTKHFQEKNNPREILFKVTAHFICSFLVARQENLASFTNKVNKVLKKLFFYIYINSPYTVSKKILTITNDF